MTSLFSRLQKLNKDGRWSIREDGGELDILDGEGRSVAHADLGWPDSRQNVAAMVECRNSLPAVLNLIEAAQQALDETNVPGDAPVTEFIPQAEPRPERLA